MGESRDDPALGLFRVLSDDGNALAPYGKAPPSDATAVDMLRHMMRIRIIEERMTARQRQGKVGFYGASTGQEATPVAAGMAFQKRDWIFPALRESAIMLVRNFPLTTWLCQVYGNSGDILKGRQMPSHMSAKAVHQVAWSSCIGTQLSHAVGAAMAAGLRKDGTVVVGFCGDGATSEPDFHAALNFAGVYRPPCVMICQNNHWAISVPTSQQTASSTFAVKARAYGLPGIRVDGNDVLALHHVFQEAADRARSGGGPTFVETVTYRIGPHSSSDDPSVYRSEEEVAEWKKRDPLARLTVYLKTRNLIDDVAIESMQHKINTELSAALNEVESLGPPDVDTMFDDVFARPPWHLDAQRKALREHRARFERNT